MTWPLVTIPDFAAIGLATRQQIKAETFGLLPIVGGRDREAWEAYAIENQDWIRDSRKWENSQDEITTSPSNTRLLRGELRRPTRLLELSVNNQSEREAPDFSEGISSKIFTITSEGKAFVDRGSGPFTPIWMTSPSPPTRTTINFNLLSHRIFWEAIESAIDSQDAVLSKVLNVESKHETMIGSATKDEKDPISAFYYPVFRDVTTTNRTVVGLLAAEVSWTHFFEIALPGNARGIVCVIENACNQKFTYRLDGGEATFLGFGDMHDRSFDNMVEKLLVSDLVKLPEAPSAVLLDFEHCPFDLHVYPSGQLKKGYLSTWPIVFAAVLTVLFMLATAFIYRSRTKKKIDDQSIVVLERNFHPTAEKRSLKAKALQLLGCSQESSVSIQVRNPEFSATLQPRSEISQTSIVKDDTFQHATVVFADITGFSKWRGRKDAATKAALFEEALQSFRSVAVHHGILQVEVVGQYFVCVAGKQNSADEHALRLVRFSVDCRNKTSELFTTMKAPELSMRFGVHCGFAQLKSDEDRDSGYRLIGDTIEVARQMVKKGKPSKIHVSVDVAERLNLAGKSNWVSRRTNQTHIKGLGKMPTYWIKTKDVQATNSIDLVNSCNGSVATESSTLEEEDPWEESVGSNSVDPWLNSGSQFDSVVDRNVTILLGYLKKIHGKRLVVEKFSQRVERTADTAAVVEGDIIEQSREVVVMPAFESMVAANMVNTDLIMISDQVESELRLYISSIAASYHANSFHNFDHATHVAVSLDDMLQKIATPSDADKTYLGFNGKHQTAEELAAELDDRSFGISSDPLTEFALILSALVHDVDHAGVSNFQLIQEKSPLADLYKNKSVAEQNSVDIAWWLLMTPSFSTLRSAIYSNGDEKRRFRQILVNSVIATDILDRDLKLQRDRRWKKAFQMKKCSKLPEKVRMKDIQATMVIEHIMQAADSAHTMQNFRTYLKWNKMQFEEMYQAFHQGRADNDPSKSWYKSELAFFDKFVIPLATRLRDCGVLGESGNECLTNAKENRKKWADRGKRIVQTMLEEFSRKVIASQEDTVCFS
eukprot:scaffold4056_cov115-Cylindrotheca_fusiformis.AAC.3